MFSAHASTATPDNKVGNTRPEAAHRSPEPLILGAGTTVAVAMPVDMLPSLPGLFVEFVVTEAPAYIISVEDKAEQVYEVWQPCEHHATTHKVYAGWTGDELPLEFGLSVPLLYVVAEVIED